MNLVNIQVSKELNISPKVIDKVISLFNEGATIPFIARYRKEMTGNLDEVELIQIKEKSEYWKEFNKRKEFILNTILEQGKLTDKLKESIQNAHSLQELEDYYLPFKQKRKTKGEKAIGQGLKPLAIFIQKQEYDFAIEKEAKNYVGRNGVESLDEALEGAIHILAEWISENTKLRERLREQFQRHALITSKVKKGKAEEGDKYRDYFKFSERTNRIASHRILALLRGEKEKFLNIKIDVDNDRALENIKNIISRRYVINSYVNKAIKESYKRILQGNFESEIKKELKESADEDSIKVFASNLRQLLLQAPLGAANVLAIDPGFRSGCKIAILNRNGKFIQNDTIFPHPPQNNGEEAVQKLNKLVEKHQINAIAIGNGTAGLETEKLCRNHFKNQSIQIFSVNEAGASIYSASEIARNEFPKLDLTVRGAISIGRRLMDPLAELVKIDAKSIGVGQYQHDVNQTQLNNKLTEVVEHCVNHVGVELNTASYPILSFVSGLGPTIAKNIVDYRNENGDFEERKELLKVPKMGKKTFEQAAGFLRIENGKNPLDNTIIHPESYALVKHLSKLNKASIQDMFVKDISDASIQEIKASHDHQTIDLILNELKKPTRDPRESLEEPEYNNISSIEELRAGLVLNGTINNITNFGAFVDIGIKESGLVHISEVADEYISNIQDVLSLNEQVKVKVLSVDLQAKRVQLSIKQA